jgi:hypothetical protein
LTELSNSSPAARRQGRALVLACPAEDLAAARTILAGHGMALLPAGGEGDLDQASDIEALYIVEITSEGARPAATFLAELAHHIPLSEPSPTDLLPATWMSRHPDAYPRARQPAPSELSEAELWDDEDEPISTQVFVPVSSLTTLQQADWVFTNELVRKQQRDGRSFAPRVPTVVGVPD